MSRLILPLMDIADTTSSHSASTWIIENSFTRKKISSLTFCFDMRKVYSKDFIRALLNYKLCFLKRLSVLTIEGCNQVTLENLIHVLHDLSIEPHRLFFNNKEMFK